MHNLKVEIAGKCRRMEYDLNSGQVLGVTSGGGVLAKLTGDDYIVHRYRDYDAPSRFGCISMHYNRVKGTRPLWLDLSRVKECNDCIDTIKACDAVGDLEGKLLAQDTLLTCRDEMVIFAPKKPLTKDVEGVDVPLTVPEQAEELKPASWEVHREFIKAGGVQA